jgi:hypothetical protein
VKRSRDALRIKIIAALLTLVFLSNSSLTGAQALKIKSEKCKKMITEIDTWDKKRISELAEYSSKYKKARGTNLVEDNMDQTRALLELYENDRSISLRALEDKTCFSPTELKIINNILKNSTYDAETVKNWLDVLIGIPGKKYYGSYLNFIKDVTTPKPTYPCAKSGTKYKKLICKLKDGNLAWTDSVKPISSETVTSWPTDYIDGKVNWREAAKRITEFFKELSAASSTSSTKEASCLH